MDPQRLRRIITGVTLTAVLGVLLYLLRQALTPVFIALLLAYLLDPVIDRLEARKVNRSAAILILAAVAMVVITVLGTFLIIQAQREVVSLYHNLPGYIETAQNKLAPLTEKHLGVEMPQTFSDTIEEVKKQLKDINPQALKPVSAVAGKVFANTLAFVSWLIGLVIIPVFLFYFLRDWDTLKYEVLDFVPVPYREYVKDKAVKIDEVLGAFIRGQFTLCVILGVLYSLGLIFIGVDLAVVIGMAAGIFFIVPYLGTALGVIAALVMVLLEHGFDWHIIGVAAVFGGVQLIEGTLLTPKIMGDKVGLSPVIVIIALLVGANLLGLLGMLIAIPAAAILKVFLADALVTYKNSEFFKGEGNGNQ